MMNVLQLLQLVDYDVKFIDSTNKHHKTFIANKHHMQVVFNKHSGCVLSAVANGIQFLSDPEFDDPDDVYDAIAKELVIEDSMEDLEITLDSEESKQTLHEIAFNHGISVQQLIINTLSKEIGANDIR